jgi:hypothetical protein
MEQQPIELADVFRAGFTEYCSQTPVLPLEHWKAANAIMSCHTSALGGHVFQCGHCGHEQITYNSCRNRHCPSCQAGARIEWVEKRMEELLPVPYFHVVFTLPAELNPFALRNKASMYNILFRAASETLRALAEREKYLGAEIGFIAVLHTWGQNLMDHPHLHCVVPAGGLSDGREEWVKTPDKDFLFPVKVVSKLFRGKFLDLFRKAIGNREILFHGALRQFEDDPESFRRLVDSLYKTEWVVYLKEPFASPQAVLKYLGRYTHRIAISNRRITGLTEETVSFKWKDYADGNKEKVMTLSRVEFIRRFLMHVLPTGFVRIRYFGFMGQAVRKERLRLCRALLDVPEPQNEEKKEEVIIEGLPVKERSWVCPVCKTGHLALYLEIPRPHQRNVEMAAVA